MKLEKLYKLIKETDSSVLGGAAVSDLLGTSDGFATGDYRLPKVIGGIQRRIPARKKKKKLRKLESAS